MTTTEHTATIHDLTMFDIGRRVEISVDFKNSGDDSHTTPGISKYYGYLDSWSLTRNHGVINLRSKTEPIVIALGTMTCKFKYWTEEYDD